MKVKTSYVAIIILVILVFVISAFIYTVSIKDRITDESSSDNSDKILDNDDKVKLVILSSSYLESPEGDVERELVKEFMEQNPDIEIEMVGVPMNNAIDTITTLAISDELPDIFVNSLELMPRFYDLGICLNIADYLDQEYLDGFFPYALDSITINNELQYFPRFTLTSAIIYRKDWFSEKGLAIPETWDEFVDVAKTLTSDTDGDGEIDRWGFAMVASNNMSGSTRFVNVLRSFDAYEIKYENGEWQTDIDSSKGKAAFKFYRDLYNEYNVVPPGPLEVSYAEAIAMMANEKTAMMLTGPHSLGAITKLNSELDGKFGSFVIPRQDHHTSTLSVIGYSISKECEHPDEAIRFLKFICEKENLVEWNQKTGRIPARIEAASDARVQRSELKGFNEAYGYLEPLEQVSFYAELLDIIAETYQGILIDSVDLDIAVEGAATQIRQIIEHTPDIQ